VKCMTKPRLKRCPWCLSTKALSLKPQERGGFAVQCLECKVTGPVFVGDTCGEGTDPRMAVYGWNRHGVGWLSQHPTPKNSRRTPAPRPAAPRE
jgi:hypothetical protein